MRSCNCTFSISLITCSCWCSAGNVHISWVSVSTSNTAQKGEVQHLKRINEEIVHCNFLFVFCFPIQFVPRESVPIMIFQRAQPPLKILTTQQIKGSRKLLNSHPLWEGIAWLTEQVNIPLQNSASHNSHLIPHSHS